MVMRILGHAPELRFSKTKVFENLSEAPPTPRDFNTLRFSKRVLETQFSIHALATSFEIVVVLET
jgi:hypothetical protein